MIDMSLRSMYANLQHEEAMHVNRGKENISFEIIMSTFKVLSYSLCV